MMIVSKQNLRALTKEMFLNLMNEKGLAALEISLFSKGKNWFAGFTKLKQINEREKNENF
jgi:hypothetical protein